MSRWVMENVALDLPSSAFGNKKSRKKNFSNAFPRNV